jgi:hypothetical protein
MIYTLKSLVYRKKKKINLMKYVGIFNILYTGL